MTARWASVALMAAVIGVSATDADAASRRCGGEQPTIIGSRDSDVLTGTAREDVIRAGRGNDLIAALGGDDTVCGGRGNDEITGDEGNDVLRTGAGDDRANGGEGDDHIEGQGGNDEADGREGTDGCLVEVHSGCEADLSVSAGGTPPYKGGDQTVYVGQLVVSNMGPTPAAGIAATGTLPPEAEFVASDSDRACEEVATDELACAVPPIQVRREARMDVAFRFPDCPPAGQQITFRVTAQDFFTADPGPAPNTYSITLMLERAPSCP